MKYALVLFFFAFMMALALVMPSARAVGEGAVNAAVQQAQKYQAAQPGQQVGPAPQIVYLPQNTAIVGVKVNPNLLIVCLAIIVLALSAVTIVILMKIRKSLM